MSADDNIDIKIAITAIEKDIKYLTDSLKEQKELLNTLLIDSQKRNDVAREDNIHSEFNRKRQDEQIDSVKYTIRLVQDRLDTLHNDVKSLKEDSNESLQSMQIELNQFNSKFDDNWLFIIKVIALVLAGAIVGASAVANGIKGWLGL